MFCAKCGKDNPPEGLFCAGCGEQLTAASAVPAPGGPRFTKTHLIIAGVIVALLLAVSGGFAWRHFSRGGDEGMPGGSGIKVTVNGKTFEVERGVNPEEEKGLAAEYSADTIRGQVINTGWGKYVVKSNDTGKVYLIRVGRGTRYNIRRKPGVGNTVRITYHLRRGALIGDRVVTE